MSKTTAEHLYRTIYGAAQQGTLPPENLDIARKAYARWAQSQDAYLTAAEAGKSDLSQALIMQRQLCILMTIAEQVEGPPWKSNSLSNY